MPEIDSKAEWVSTKSIAIGREKKVENIKLE